MKSFLFALFLLPIVLGLGAQETSESLENFPFVNYPADGGGEVNIGAAFAEHDLSIVFIYNSNGPAIKQLLEIEKGYDTWVATHDIQLIYLSVNRDMDRAVSQADRLRDKMDGLIVFDVQVKSTGVGMYDALQLNPNLPGFTGMTPHTMLVNRAGEIVAQLRGFSLVTRIDKAIQAYFTAEE